MDFGKKREKKQELWDDLHYILKWDICDSSCLNPDTQDFPDAQDLT